ncbi:MAG: tryptophan--tRNA ligase [bacterium]|nr:tryptophan--tRNA ligase [bacterium]
MSAKILVSGVKPSGRPHIGNYFGAMKQFMELQHSYESYVFIADMHALTNVQNPRQLAENTLDVAIDYLAIGLDPKKVTLFKQSDVPLVAELGWIFNCITTMPYLERAHAYKDARAKNKEINVGIFDYPMLMAADILLYDADIVPTGADQKQHIEFTRDTAEKFNRLFGETFRLPEPSIPESVGTIPGTDGRKMSKSYNNTIGLFAPDDEIAKAVMSIPTDSKGVDEPKDPDKDNVFALHKFFTEGPEFAELRDRYQAGGIGYKESKELLIRNMSKFITPLREKRESIAKNKSDVLKVLEEGAVAAREKANLKMDDVRAKVGFKLT